MSDLLFGIGTGLVFALGGLLFLAILIGIGEVLEWFEKRNKK